MDDSKVAEEIDIIVAKANEVDIKDFEQLIQFVKVAVAASDRLIIHASNLYERTAVQEGYLSDLTKNIEGLREATQNLANRSDVTWDKARRATRISLTTLVVLLIVGAGFFWNQIPGTYKVVAISAVAGWLVPKLAGWLWDEFRS